MTVVDDLRLDTLLRMLKTPHFSTKMNSLKEVAATNPAVQTMEKAAKDLVNFVFANVVIFVCYLSVR